MSKFDFAETSYAQEGEDLVLQRFLGDMDIDQGFYIDIGAHHPKRFSNTYNLYLRGWSGICIDPISVKDLFKKYRPRDLFLNIGIGTKKDILEYYIFDEQALNTFDKDIAESRIKNTNYKLTNKIEIEVLPLSEVLTCYCENQKIDLISIDTEGFDLQILKSNNWEYCSPALILVEELSPDNNEVSEYLAGKGYTQIAKTYNTLFFKKKG